jgi:hypothetical protein
VYLKTCSLDCQSPPPQDYWTRRRQMHWCFICNYIQLKPGRLFRKFL